MSSEATAGKDEPRILVFTTNSISDPGVDLAGSSHMHYSPSVVLIPVPCSSGIKPKWIVHALDKGFDGVFVAADGGDCAFLSDCNQRTARIVEEAQRILKEKGDDPRRVKMSGICSVCAEPFVQHMEKFSAALAKLNAA